jgi:threonine aldolase
MALFAMSVCLSKDSGAGRFGAGARRSGSGGLTIRKRLGGGMRQAGIPAAAGRYAMEHNIERLVEDHARRAAGRGAGAVRGGGPARVRTNIVPLI